MYAPESHKVHCLTLIMLTEPVKNILTVRTRVTHTTLSNIDHAHSTGQKHINCTHKSHIVHCLTLIMLTFFHVSPILIISDVDRDSTYLKVDPLFVLWYKIFGLCSLRDQSTLLSRNRVSRLQKEHQIDKCLFVITFKFMVSFLSVQ